MLRLLLAVGFACALLIAPVDGRAAVVAQDAPCGVVDALDYPIDISDTLANRYDDFGLFRSRFGGRHTGLDVAFNRRGEPVYAAARGIVTYADPEGWDTEKGVVIIRHTFPDGGIYYTLYGHMEQSDDIQFPRVGACIERGDPVGVVGWPSRGLPHLHYEIRNFLPDDGGPGYVEDNPLLSGWYDPLDFTELWQIRLAPGL
ncbi:MAG: M23 family metallopeptidase [Anaerolineae bacterium]